LVVDGEAAVREFAHLNGTPDRLLRTSDQVTQALQSAMQAAQQNVPGAAPEEPGE
jgi:hypothetical protein